MSDLLRGSLGRDIVLEVVGTAGVWKVLADRNQLENAILNIAINARDAMPDGGRLTIETQNAHIDNRYAAANDDVTPGQYVLVAITDTGTGMTGDVIQKVFEPFYTTKGVGKGTGLGLSQVYGFVRQSGGYITMHSELGHGATAKIYLPRLTKDFVAAPLPASTQAISEGHQELILVVDDDEMVRQVAVDSLRELGYLTIEAADAATAITLLEQNPKVALLFTDIVMPEKNGRKLADEVQSLRPNLRILFTTGYTRDAVIHNGILNAGVYLIGKPYTLEDLADKVREVLASRLPR